MKKIAGLFQLFIYFLIFSGENSHKTVFHGESFIYSREKKWRTWTLTEKVLRSVRVIVPSVWQCASACFGKNLWLLGSWLFWKPNALVCSPKPVNNVRKITIQPMYPYTDMNKTSKMKILCQFIGSIKRVLSFLRLLGNGQRPPNSFHEGCYKSSIQ